MASTTTSNIVGGNQNPAWLTGLISIGQTALDSVVGRALAQEEAVQEGAPKVIEGAAQKGGIMTWIETNWKLIIGAAVVLGVWFYLKKR